MIFVSDSSSSNLVTFLSVSVWLSVAYFTAHIISSTIGNKEENLKESLRFFITLTSYS